LAETGVDGTAPRGMEPTRHTRPASEVTRRARRHGGQAIPAWSWDYSCTWNAVMPLE
jgi:hypothetical protein